MMEFETWEPVYESILTAFGYDRAEDRRARDRLDALYARDATRKLPDFTGQTVAVAGAADSLTAELSVAQSADAIVAASVAADRLEGAGVSVDCMVTDLDKTPETALELTHDGTPVAVHAHGDNIPAVENHVPECDHDWLLPTTQARPTDRVSNFGGFTDGDRAAFLACAFGADELLFPGWRFDDETVSAEKAQKLQWAERLLYWLERRRGMEFGCLDGRRGAVDTASLPG